MTFRSQFLIIVFYGHVALLTGIIFFPYHLQKKYPVFSPKLDHEIN